MNSGYTLVYDAKNGQIGVIRIDNTGQFHLVKDYPVGTFAPNWSNIVSIGNNMFLFYNRSDGRISTVRLDTAGNYHVRDYKAGTLATSWTNVVNVIENIVLFYNSGTGQLATIQINPADGTFNPRHNYPDRTIRPGWTNIAADQASS